MTKQLLYLFELILCSSFQEPKITVCNQIKILKMDLLISIINNNRFGTGLCVCIKEELLSLNKSVKSHTQII